MNTKHLKLIKLVICGPSDVKKEIDLAKQVIDKWNQLNAEARGLNIQHQNWLTDTYPDLSNRPQNVINSQLIDKAKIIVGVFWWRFGTPTGVTDSGTKEEILRAAANGKKVMVYFSDLDPVPPGVDIQQLKMLSLFKEELREKGICRSFKSRDEFRKMFEAQLTLAINSLNLKPTFQKPRRNSHPTVRQNAKVNNGDVIQVVGDGNTFNARPTVERIIKERRPGSVSAAEEKQLNDWIKDLAEGEVGMPRQAAYSKWGGIFKNTFNLPSREDLPSTEMASAAAWHRKQKAIQAERNRTKDPDSYRKLLIGSIKAVMKKLGQTDETYYPSLSKRLKFKIPFTSLKNLTDKDLKRVYSAARSDAKSSPHRLAEDEACMF
jgi:hypothetical protein